MSNKFWVIKNKFSFIIALRAYYKAYAARNFAVSWLQLKLAITNMAQIKAEQHILGNSLIYQFASMR